MEREKEGDQREETATHSVTQEREREKNEPANKGASEQSEKNRVCQRVSEQKSRMRVEGRRPWREQPRERKRERGRICSAGSSYSCDVTKISAVRFAIGLPAFAEFNIEHSHALSRKHHTNPANRTLLLHLSRQIEKKDPVHPPLYDSTEAASTKRRRLHSVQVL